MITLPNATRNRSHFSISTMEPGVSWAAQAWVPLPVPEVIVRDIGGNTRMGGTVAAGGYTVEQITRACLPDEDMASFCVDFGIINGISVVPKDLAGHWVRIDVIDNEAFPSGDDTEWPSSGGYKCVFVGYVYNAKVTIDPTTQTGVANGKKTYYCMGILSRTRDWPLVYHGAYGGAAGTTLKKCYGNPGYNYPINGLFRSTIGNKSSSSDYLTWGADSTQGWKGHALPIDAASTAKWTDEETISHALSSSREDGEPVFIVDFSQAAGLFSGTFAWAVNEGDTCFDHLRRVCSRSRGRGSVYADFVGDGSPTGSLTLYIKARPSFSGTATYMIKDDPDSLVMGDEQKINGQTSGADTELDLVGDHRLFGSFQYEDRASAVFDYLELVGERIQEVVNLQLRDSVLQKGWTAGDESEWAACTNFQQRITPRFRHVYRRFTLKQGWDFKGYVDTATPGTSYPDRGKFDVACSESGAVTADADAEFEVSNSSVTSRLMADLPLYEGKDYRNLTAGYWSGASEYMPPPRMQPQLLYQQKEYSGQPSAEKRWIPLEKYGFNVQVDDFGVLIMHQAEDSTGVRVMNYNGTFASTPTEISGLVTETAGLDPGKMMLVMGLELSSHVRMAGLIGPINAANNLANEKGRRLTINISGLHLWVGSKNAIWQVDPLNQSSDRGCQALRFSPDADLTLVRDDRDALSFMFGLAKKYYGEVHNPGTWSLRDCGLKSYFSETQSGTLTYPTLGRIVSTVAVSPTQKITLNTPVTSIHYDHNEGITTWRTDYVNYQPGIQQ